MEIYVQEIRVLSITHEIYLVICLCRYVCQEKLTFCTPLLSLIGYFEMFCEDFVEARNGHESISKLIYWIFALLSALHNKRRTRGETGFRNGPAPSRFSLRNSHRPTTKPVSKAEFPRFLLV